MRKLGRIETRSTENVSDETAWTERRKNKPAAWAVGLHFLKGAGARWRNTRIVAHFNTASAGLTRSRLEFTQWARMDRYGRNGSTTHAANLTYAASRRDHLMS